MVAETSENYHIRLMRYETKVSDARLFGLDRPVKTRACDCPGCEGVGEYRAPKSRDQLRDYYWFCLDHVREYNAKWDYHAGLSESAIEAQIKAASCWERDTWPLGGWRRREAEVKQRVAEEFFADGDEAPMENPMRHHIPAAVIAALAVLELKPPVDFGQIKLQYKILVKRHHPDANGGSKEAEARLKDINQAFTSLRKVYEG